MTSPEYGYAPPATFEQGKDYYDLAMGYVGQGRRDDAHQSLLSAITIFKSCTQQHPEAPRYLKMAEQELQKLGR